MSEHKIETKKEPFFGTEFLQDLKTLGSRLLLISIPPAYAGLREYKKDPSQTKYENSKRALFSGAKTLLACAITSVIIDYGAASFLSRERQVGFKDFDNGKINFYQNEFLMRKPENRLVKGFFPILRFALKDMYGWQTSSTKFSGELKHESRTYDLKGSFSGKPNLEQITSQDLINGTSEYILKPQNREAFLKELYKTD